jgi:hypothetical protein
MSNTGTRGIRIARNGETVTWSSYTRDATDKGRSTHFGVPTDASSRARCRLGDGVYTAGTVTDAQRKPAVITPTEPTPTPTPTPTATAPTVGPGAAGNAARYFPLAITEILGDNPGTDLYEYLEVTNTTDQPIDLDAQKIGIRYNTSQERLQRPARLPPGRRRHHRHGDPRRRCGPVLDELQGEQHAALHEHPAVPGFLQPRRRRACLPFRTQEGFANGGNRGFSLVKDGAVINRAWVGAGKIDSAGGVVQFGVPSTIGGIDAVVIAENARAPPVRSRPLRSRARSPAPTDAALTSPILQITELAPDTVNARVRRLRVRRGLQRLRRAGELRRLRHQLRLHGQLAQRPGLARIDAVAGDAREPGHPARHGIGPVGEERQQHRADSR